MNRYQCNQCEYEFLEDEAYQEIVYAGTLEEPAEYLDRCPECNSDNIEKITFPLCISCEDQPVHHEGDQCIECLTCQAEAISDAAKGH